MQPGGEGGGNGGSGGGGGIEGGGGADGNLWLHHVSMFLSSPEKTLACILRPARLQLISPHEKEETLN